MELNRRGFLGALLKGAAVAAVAPALLLPGDPGFDEPLRRYWQGWSAPSEALSVRMLSGPLLAPLSLVGARTRVWVGDQAFEGVIEDAQNGFVRFAVPPNADETGRIEVDWPNVGDDEIVRVGLALPPWNS